MLHEGNLRYQRGKLQLRDYSVPGEYTANRQTPFAAIITCADSRLSPPLVFDLHHGNVFVSRSRATASTWGLWVIVPAIAGASSPAAAHRPQRRRDGEDPGGGPSHPDTDHQAGDRRKAG